MRLHQYSELDKDAKKVARVHWQKRLKERGSTIPQVDWCMHECLIKTDELHLYSVTGEYVGNLYKNIEKDLGI